MEMQLHLSKIWVRFQGRPPLLCGVTSGTSRYILLPLSHRQGEIFTSIKYQYQIWMAKYQHDSVWRHIQGQILALQEDGTKSREDIQEYKGSGLIELQHSLRSDLIFFLREDIADESQKKSQVIFHSYPLKWTGIQIQEIKYKSLSEVSSNKNIDRSQSQWNILSYSYNSLQISDALEK